MSAQTINLSDLQVFDSEPRLFDICLGEALQFASVYKIRDLIRSNLPELSSHGEVFTAAVKTSEKGGRPSVAYYLNEAQALLVAMFSRTERAAEVRRQLIEVFMAWRRGQVMPPLSPAFEGEALSLQERRLCLDMVREARVTFGPQRAALLWGALKPLPPIPALPKPDGREAERCLGLFLSSTFGEHEMTLREAIEIAWSSREMCDRLSNLGIRVMFDPDGVALSNTVRFVTSCFEASEFENRRWIRLLRALPGVTPVNTRYGNEQTRGTFIPVELIEKYPL